jgi:hypothetical protein
MLPQPQAVDKQEVNACPAAPFNTGMKYLAAALALASVAAAAAPPSQRQPVDLRRTLEQYHPESSTPQPRQLTAVERAELRRQLSEYKQPPRRR